MEKSSRIYVAGHKGLVGSAITASLVANGYNNLVMRAYEELDLCNQREVDAFFKKEKPDYVFLAAALVGGIMANNTYRADFIYNNLMIQSNVIYSAWKYKVRKLLFLGSTCIYPKNAPQPLKENYLLSSPLEYTNEPYAIAKIAGLKMCESFNIQYKTNFISVMPTNLYGPGDNYNLEKSHVLPALLRKIHLGKCLEEGNWDEIRKDLKKNPVEKINENSQKEDILEIFKKYGIESDRSLKAGNDKNYGLSKSEGVTVAVWGTGTPLREFMYSQDMAEACVYIMEKIDVKEIVDLNHTDGIVSDYHPPHFLNIGTGEEVSIKDLVLIIKKLTGFKGRIVFDDSKPDGTMRKTIDIGLLKNLGFKHKHTLAEGLAKTYITYQHPEAKL
jgi:GDP-L-fucose synthase